LDISLSINFVTVVRNTYSQNKLGGLIFISVHVPIQETDKSAVSKISSHSGYGVYFQMF